MKQILAIFASHRVEQVERGLYALAPFPGFTFFRGTGVITVCAIEQLVHIGERPHEGQAEQLKNTD